MRSLLLVACLSFLAIPAVVRAGITYVETIDGELSTNGAAPTPLAFSEGVNMVTGTMGAEFPGATIDADIFYFTVLPGQFLTSIEVLQFGPPVNNSFVAIGPGTSISTTNPALHLSNTLINSTGEILDDLDAGSYSGGTGLTAPLVAGTYTFWIQEASDQIPYSLGFTITPEPASAGLLLLPAMLVLRRRSARFAGK